MMLGCLKHSQQDGDERFTSFRYGCSIIPLLICHSIIGSKLCGYCSCIVNTKIKRRIEIMGKSNRRNNPTHSNRRLSLPKTHSILVLIENRKQISDFV